MLIERSGAISYLMAIIIFAPSFTLIVSEIFAVETCMTLTLTFTMVKVRCKCANRKAMCDFTYVDNGNICSLYHRFRYKSSRNVHDLYLDLDL